MSGVVCWRCQLPLDEERVCSGSNFTLVCAAKAERPCPATCAYPELLGIAEGTVKVLQAQLAEAQRENAAWRAIASAAAAASVSLMVMRQGSGWRVQSRPQSGGTGDTVQAAAIDLATKLNLLPPKAEAGGAR